MELYRVEGGIEYCYCKKCDTEHFCAEHFKNKERKHGYSLSCKSSTKNYYKAPAIPKSVIVETESKKILKQLGFDLNSTIPVHEQFLLKHELWTNTKKTCSM